MVLNKLFPYPYQSVFIDASVKDFLKAISLSLISSLDRDSLIHDLCALWTTNQNHNHVLPCLSVRTGLDLYLSAQKFPAGSEVIMSAVNIPAMVHVIEAHQLKVVPWDIDIETMAPKIHLIDRLVAPDRTCLLLVANIFGRGFDLTPYIEAAQRYRLPIVEDWAEGFSGLEYTGHPKADLSLFSFGPIKYYTAFGGCIAKVRDDAIYTSMLNIYNSYTVQPRSEYLYKVLKYYVAFLALDCPWFQRPGVFFLSILRIDYKAHAVAMLRGFPADKLMQKLRHRPSDALLAMLLYRLCQCDSAEVAETNVRAEYVLARLPSGVGRVGMKAALRNHWLFPVIVPDPGTAMNALFAAGIDAYRGATQLNVVEPIKERDTDPVVVQFESPGLRTNENRLMSTACQPMSSLCDAKSSYAVTHNDAVGDAASPVDIKCHEEQYCYPSEAKYLIDHVIYLPINKTVPLSQLKRVTDALVAALSPVCPVVNKEMLSASGRVLLRSKL